MSAPEPGTESAQETGGPTPLLVLDVVGLTRSSWPTCRTSGRWGAGRASPPDHRAARRHLRRPVHLPHRRHTGRARHRRQRLVLPRARRRPALAPAQRTRRGRQALGRRPPRPPRLHRRQHLLVVRHGRRHRLDGHPAPRLLRRRPQGTRLLHPAPRPPRRTDRQARHLPPLPLLGPGADLVSSRWIIDATRHIIATRTPDLALCYLPHLDYDLQRYGPDDPRSHRAAADLDRAMAPLLADARAEGRTVVALSEYGITRVERPSTSTAPCAARACWRSTPRTAWNTWTRWPPVPSPSPTTSSPTSTYAAPRTWKRPGRPSRTCRHRAAPRRRGQEGPPPGPPPLRRAGRRRGEGCLVHVLLLARRRPRPRLRAARRDPPQTRLRPRRAVHGPPGPLRARQGRLGGRPQEARPALPHGGRPPGPLTHSWQPRRLPESDDEGPLILCSTPHAFTDRVRATEVKSLLLQLAGLH